MATEENNSGVALYEGPLTQIVYQLNDAGQYVGPAIADMSPLEPGVFLIPAGCVEDSPPEPVTGKIRTYINGVWTHVDIPAPPAAEPPAPLTAEERAILGMRSIQKMLDDTAIAEGYDSILSAASYASTPAGTPFKAEGTAFAVWRAKCWAKAIEIRESVVAGAAEPTVEQLIAAMPALVLP